MSAEVSVGAPVPDLSPNTWYSIQSFSTDYYLGWNNAAPTQIQLFGEISGSTLWRFTLVGSDLDRAYAVQVQLDDGEYCLYLNGSTPAALPCGSDAGQVQFYTAAESSGSTGTVIVPYGDTSFVAVQGDDADEGDTLDFVPQNQDGPFGNVDVDALWALRSESAVDTQAFPTLSATYAGAGGSATTSTSTSTQTLNATTTGSASSTVSDSIPVITAGSTTIAVPTGTPSPRPINFTSPASSSSNEQQVVTLTTTTDAPAPTEEPAATDSASASPSVEMQTDENAAGTALPTTLVLLCTFMLAIAGLTV